MSTFDFCMHFLYSKKPAKKLLFFVINKEIIIDKIQNNRSKKLFREDFEMKKKKKNAYTEDGVNVPLGDKLSSYAGKLCAQTFKNSKYINVHDFSKGYFRGPKTFEPINLPPGTTLDLSPDGAGTKTIITDAAMKHALSARDWLAMCSGDIMRWGGKPVLLINDLNVSSLGENSESETYQAACELLLGLKKTCDDLGYVMYKGETAEMGPCVSSGNTNATLKYIWSGTAFGLMNVKNMITGKDLATGQAIMALYDNGFGANGGSSVRKAFERKFGEKWYTEKNAKRYIELAATPCTLYDKFLTHINGWNFNDLLPLIRSYLNVHLTGGSFKGKFFEDILCRYGFSAELDNLFDPPEIVNLCGHWRGIDPTEFYETFSGGQRVLSVIDNNRVREYITIAERFGLKAKRCGEITKKTDRPKLIIHSKFKTNEIVTFKK